MLLLKDNSFNKSLRHEHLSALLLHLPDVRTWLAACSQLDLEVITASVLSHHIKAALDGEWKWCQPRGSRTLRLFLQHHEVNAIFERIRVIANLSEFPGLPCDPWTDKPPWIDAWQHGIATAKKFGQVNTARQRKALFAVSGESGRDCFRCCVFWSRA